MAASRAQFLLGEIVRREWEPIQFGSGQDDNAVLEAKFTRLSQMEELYAGAVGLGDDRTTAVHRSADHRSTDHGATNIGGASSADPSFAQIHGVASSGQKGCTIFPGWAETNASGDLSLWAWARAGWRC